MLLLLLTDVNFLDPHSVFVETILDGESRMFQFVWDAEEILFTFALSLLYRPRASDTQSTTNVICPSVGMNKLSLQSHAEISTNLLL